MNPTYSPGLSVVVLVKDDAERLDRCLASIKAIADDLIVMDTGSADGSVGVAKSHGARVFETAWVDAFDAPLNELLDKVETEWTFRVDSDEVLDEASVDELRRIMATDDVFFSTVVRVDAQPEGPDTQSDQQRLWRTHPSLRYEGVVHEHFPIESMQLAAEGRKMTRSGVRLLHEGFKKDRLAKLERNLRLIRKQLAERPSALFYELSLADTLMELGQDEGRQVLSDLAARLVSESKRPTDVIVAMVIGKAMAQVSDDDLHSPRTGKLIKFTLQWLSELPPLVFSALQLEERRGNLRAVYDLLRQLDVMGRTNRYSTAIPFNPLIIREACWAGIVQIAVKLGKRDVALQYQKMLAQAERMKS